MVKRFKRKREKKKVLKVIVLDCGVSPGGGVGSVACDVLLGGEACVWVLDDGARSRLSEGQCSVY